MINSEKIEPGELRRCAEDLAANWNYKANEIIFVRNFINLVYKIKKNNKTYFLRITPQSHRTEKQILSELYFINYLSRQNLYVSKPVKSADDKLIHSFLLNGVNYYACVFEEAKGDEYEKINLKNQDLFFLEAGKTLGKLHKASMSFKPHAGFKRFSLNEESRWSRFPELIPKKEIEAWNIYEELLERIKCLPNQNEYYGLIHGDFTILNIRIDNEKINIFDFDDCSYHFYAYEISVFLHYFGSKTQDIKERIFSKVLEGYSEYKTIDKGFISQIPDFGIMRLLYSFLVFAEEWGFKKLNQQQQNYFDYRRKLFKEEASWLQCSNKFILKKFRK